ncbi:MULTISPECIES: hypothetical protein, partial [unclassified Pseudomonas]|uniref:hypothetical protein n=1 Tax=unclassified Pseudomonas TaxID=196821 RepID=UPI001C48B769
MFIESSFAICLGGCRRWFQAVLAVLLRHRNYRKFTEPSQLLVKSNLTSRRSSRVREFIEIACQRRSAGLLRGRALGAGNKRFSKQQPQAAS